MKKAGLKGKKPKAVICVESGLQYDSIEDASRKLRISATYLERCLMGKSGTAGGYHWRYEKGSARSRREKDPSSVKRRGDIFAVRNLDSGKVYGSIREASEDTGVGTANIYHCASGKGLTAGGFRWEYVDEERRGQAIQVRVQCAEMKREKAEQRLKEKEKAAALAREGGGEKKKSKSASGKKDLEPRKGHSQSSGSVALPVEVKF